MADQPLICTCAGRMWWIQSVYVVPHLRRRGLYTRLYKEVKAKALAEGVGGLRLYADEGNTRAHETYKAMGMANHYVVFEDGQVGGGGD